MKTLKGILTKYEKIIEASTHKLANVKKKIYRIGTIRLILFIAGIAGVIYFWSLGGMVVVGVLLVTILPFLILVKYHNRLFYEKEYLEEQIKLNQQEIDAINYKYDSFDGGEEYIDPSHLYSYDLDVFGKNSLFQYINRTATLFGKRKLAEWLIKHLDNKNDIQERQAAVKELAPELSLRQDFRIYGLLYKGNMDDGEQLGEWSKTKSYFVNRKIFKLLIWLVPLTNLLLFIGALVELISFNWLGFSFVFFFLCNMGLQKSINKFYSSYDSNLKILSTYARLMELVESKQFSSSILISIQNKLRGNDKKASKTVHELAAKMNALDQRNNFFISILLNGFLFWELRQVMNVESWKEENGASLPQWLEAIGEMEALCSLATFAYNHPDYVYPFICPAPFEMRAKDMAHPLMDRNKCVRNDVDIEKYPFFLIITGANMAGKSTYLRTVGINYLLACIGVPVACSVMSLYPSHLITSLRTSDSLTDNESYFFAELKRLKLIIDKLNAGERLFIILDEILKGTNSVDKQKGSLALIEQFMRLDATGLIATHDLLLGSLQEHYPENIRNYRFEADITNDELTFSYKLQEGVAQNMNACFLMNKMGITVDK